jgi:hypothetical protein
MPYKVLDSQVVSDDMDKRLEQPLTLVTVVLQPLSCASQVIRRQETFHQNGMSHEMMSILKYLCCIPFSYVF